MPTGAKEATVPAFAYPVRVEFTSLKDPEHANP